jgi:signal transduction histidine kinase
MADQIANSIENARLFNERVMLVKQLEDRNAELERFSYTVSHDLKSPLVTIRGFLGYLKKDAHKGDLLAFDTDLKRIESATDKMQALLNDLLELSRIGRVMNSPEEVALKEIVQDALTLVIDPSRDSHVTIALQDDLPVVNVDRARMVEVYQNLIGNAVKFMGGQISPKIEIGMKVMHDAPVFFVKDNGMGIDPVFHDRVFGLFNRLNPEVEGTGIGLSLVKRIVEVHGGRIWVESEGVDKGSSFCFTLADLWA